MSLLDRIRKDARHFVSNGNEYAVPVTFSATNGAEVTVNGTAKKHHTSYDEMGNVVASLNASCTVSEKDLADKGYPVRNTYGEVEMRGHRIKWQDAAGALFSYTILEWLPDEHLGLIVFKLGH